MYVVQTMLTWTCMLCDAIVRFKGTVDRLAVAGSGIAWFGYDPM